MTKESYNLLDSVASYYAEKLSIHGATPSGVDWNSELGQYLRFTQLTKIIKSENNSFSINDLGCGYGALLNYLERDYSDFEYAGIDVSPEMVEVAKQRNFNKTYANFHVGIEPTSIKDYSLASGIFSVRLDVEDKLWRDYIINTLDILDKHSKMGFAFNCLTTYSDMNRMRKDLYYADPLVLFDLCKRRYSNNVALLHDYNLYEFTILVRKL